MNYKVVLDAAKGGSNTGAVGNGINEKDYTLLISSYISKRLSELGINNILTRTEDSNLTIDDRVKIINDTYGNGSDVIVISSNLNKGEAGAEIIYALRNSNALSYLISKSLEDFGFTVNKYYQLRDENNTALDKEELIRKTGNNQTIEIFYGSVDDYGDSLNIKNNWEDYAEGVVKGLADFLNVNYIPVSEENYYVVKVGDSLYSIAKDKNTTVNELKSLNNLTSNVLQVGQLLKLPKESTNITSNYNTYTVKAGDTIFMGNNE